MYQRLLSWGFFCVFGAFAVLRAQAPAAAAGLPPPGEIQVVQVNGTVTKSVNGQVTPVKDSDFVEQKAKVITGRQSSVVLAFSNGATTQLGEDTELVIEEFLQDPFSAALKVADLEEEPTRSNTKLHLSRGELVGKVAKLKHASGSTFIVQTPVGAAGIRGTTFRIVFRPEGAGLAFFQLSTVEGNVNFNQGASAEGATPAPGGGPQAGQTQAPDPTPAQPAQNPADPGQGGPSSQATPAAAPAGGVAVVGGQEVVIAQVSVNVTPSGQIVVTAPPQIVSATVPINAAAQAQIVAQAQNIAVAIAATTFAPTPPAQSAAPAAGGTPNRAPESTDGGPVTQSEAAGNTGTPTPGGTTPATPGSSSAKGGSGTAGASGTTSASPVQPRPPAAASSPAVIPPTTRTTPLDGRGPGG